MSLTQRLARVTTIALLAITATAVLGGCSWFRKGPKGDFALPQEQRPLEVPPDLTLPDTSGAMSLPSGGTAQVQAAPAASASGFTVPGTREQVFAQVGTALGAIDGLRIASSAQLLGSYDVSYQGSDFLVRVSTVEGGVYVSAVDPRGLPATHAAATQVIASLQAALAR